MNNFLKVLFNVGTKQFQSSGFFVENDKRIENLKYGNWGSRPYEYFWASNIVSVKGKQVIDLGVGIPSQHNWYMHVSRKLKPEYYIGIDADERIRNEEKKGKNFELRWMDMTNLEFKRESFHVAYCISVLEHLTIDQLYKSIAEIHRVLHDEGLLIVTLDEVWNISAPSHDWNVLEKDLIKNGLYQRTGKSFGFLEFLSLIEDYFIPCHSINCMRVNSDPHVLHNKYWNSCVSYVLLRKRSSTGKIKE